MELSERIRLIRKAKKLTQADVALQLGISGSAYGQHERNASRSSFESLVKIAKALDVSMGFLMDLTNKQFIEKKHNQ